MTRYRLCILCAVLTALAAWLVLGVPRASAQGEPVSFINDVAPILKENCFACHDAKKRKGKLDLTTFESMHKGGAKEIDPVVPGKPEESHILDLLNATDKSRMPPLDSGDALPKEKIAI